MSNNNTPSRLHDAVLDELIKQVEEGPVVMVKVKDEDGGTNYEPERVSPSPQLLAQAISFLKAYHACGDGDIPKNKGPVSDTLKRYAGKMPFDAPPATD